MAMAVGANDPEPDHPLTGYYFKALSIRPNYVPNVIGYNPVKMPFAKPPGASRDNYQRSNYSGLEKKANENTYALVGTGQINYSARNHDVNTGGNYGMFMPIYTPLDSSVGLYGSKKPKMYH